MVRRICSDVRPRLTQVFVCGLLLFFFGAFLDASVAFAETPTHKCNGLDAVFLVDQSSSMSANDLNSVRSNAVRTAIDILGDNAVYFCPGIQHRIAVIGFGNQSTEHGAVDPYLPGTVISPTLEGLDSWNQLRDDVIKLSIPITDSLGGTDHLAAFREAAAILGTWKAQPLGEAPRKRMVVLVTDGGPCPYVEQNEKGTWVCAWKEYGSRNGYLQQLEQLTKPLGTDFPWRGADNPNSVYLWMIAFNDAKRDGGYDYLADRDLLGRWTSIAQGHGGEVRVLSRGAAAKQANADLTTIVANILDPILGSNLVPWDCRKPIWIEPYTSNVTIIHIFRRGANPDVDIEDVNVTIRALRQTQTVAEFNRGEVTTGAAEVNDYTRDGPNERYVLYFPPPGKYLVEVQGADLCKDLDVRIGNVAITPKVLNPVEGAVFSEIEEAPYYDEVTGEPFRIQLLQQGRNKDLQPLTEMAGFPLDLSATVQIQRESGETLEEVYHLRRTDDSNAYYESRLSEKDATDFLRTRYPGRYSWKLVGTTPNPRYLEGETDADSTIPVLNLEGSFRVVRVPRFAFQVIEPAQGDVVLVNDIEGGKAIPVPVQVTVQLVDESGNPLSPKGVLTNASIDTFELALEDPTGRLLETILLRPDFSRPTLTGSIRLLNPGEKPDPEGQYKLSVRLLGNYASDKYRPSLNQQTVTFARTRVQSVAFDIGSPAEGDVYGLVDGAVTKPIQVTVQLSGEGGAPLDPVAFIPSAQASPFTASLLDKQGRLLDTEAMKLAPGSKVFSADLESGGQDPLRFDPGCYQVVVKLTDDYRKQVFRPQLQTLTHNFCMATVQPFIWRIAEPISKTQTIHPTFGWFAAPKPLPVSVEVVRKDGQPVTAGELLRSGEQHLFAGSLHAPGTSAPFEVLFDPAPEGNRFIAEWPREADRKGNYSLSVDLDGAALSTAFTPVDMSTQNRGFTRRDTLLTMPWSLLALLILIAWLILSGVLLGLANGPLAGVALAFAVDGRPAGSVNLSGRLNHHRYRAGKRQLDNEVPSLNLHHIEATGATPTADDASVAANVILYRSAEGGDPESLLEVSLNEDESARFGKFSDGQTVKLVRGSSVRVPRWLWAGIFAGLVAWASVCAYLYLSA